MLDESEVHLLVLYTKLNTLLASAVIKFVFLAYFLISVKIIQH